MIRQYFKYQIGSTDCAAACLSMLLASIYKDKSYLDDYPNSYNGELINLTQVTKFAADEGVTLTSYKFHNKEDIFKEKLNHPILVVIPDKNHLNNHMVVLNKIGRKYVRILDPQRGVCRIKKSIFLNEFGGVAMEVTDIDARKRKFKPKQINILSKPKLFLTFLFQAFSLVSLLLTMLFIDKNYDYIVPISFFGLFLILEFIYQKLMTLTIKDFDKNILEQNFLSNRDKFKDYYEPMEKFKVVLIAEPIKLISAILISIFVIFILGINSLYNLIIVGVIFIIQVFYKYFDEKYLSLRRTTLERLEYTLFKVKDLDENSFKINLESLNRISYEMMSYLKFKKYFTFFITLGLALCYQLIVGFISIDFLLIHLFLYMFLQENLDKVLDISNTIKKYHYYKSLYFHFFVS